MLMQIDGTFIFVAISFLIFLVIIRFILFHPFTKIMEEREKFLEENSKNEKESNQKASDLISDRNRKIKASRTQAGEIIKETTLNAKNAGEKLIKKTKKEVLNQLEDNRKELAQSCLDSKKELKNEVEGFVKSIVSKILSKEIEVSIDQAKIEEYLKI